MRDIKELREAKGISRNELADYLGISLSSLGYYERNERTPDADIVARLATYFGVSSDYLLEISPFKSDSDRDVASKQARDIVGLLENMCPDVRPYFLSSLEKLLLRCGDYKANPSTFTLKKLEFILERFEDIVGAYSDGIATYSDYFSEPTNGTIEYVVMNSLPDERFRNILSDACFAILSEINQLYKELPSFFSSDVEAIKSSAHKKGKQEGSHGLDQETDH